MASTSTSSIQKSFKYDVFLSFRGEDTRKNFVDNLYHALKQKGIYTYRDDEEIKKGKRISDELTRSIKDSKFYIIVFSENYASSSWCLDELVKIMECQKTNEHTAYPVFYDVEPTEVRKQSGAVGEAFATLEEKEVAGKRRDALREAADLAGWELKNTLDGYEAKVIQKIVEEISLELRFITSSVDGKLIGMETRIKDVVSLLETDICDFRMIGIKGMGGAGKTTLSRAVFDQIFFQFEGSSFVENVREISKNPLCGLKSLQKQVLSDVLKYKNINVNGVYDGKKLLKQRMRGLKVLIVLDDVDHIDQLESLAGDPEWFKPGSRVIVTTRDEQVLVAHKVPKNLILNVNLLSHEEAICLFSRYAFGTQIPIQGYEENSKQVVCYAAGLPLTIRLLGSFLCGKDELEWEDALERLKTIPLKGTLEKLELSYNSLEEDYKEIFLDVACIVKGWDKEEAIRALECRGFHARNGLRVLEQKSLLTVSSRRFNWDSGSLNLDMHDHIEEMGQNIVRRLHPDEPSKHTRLWIEEEVHDILVEDKGSEATRCIKVRKVDPLTVMKGLRKMKELRFLDVICEDKYGLVGDFGDHDFDSHFVHDDADFDYSDSLYLPNALRYLRWGGYPFTCLPKNFQANNLVGLKMQYSSIVQLWGAGMELKKLRFIDLSNCKLRTLDIGLVPNLETLKVQECYHLTELRMPVKCPKLKHLSIHSLKLKTLNLTGAENLETLDLQYEGLIELEHLEELNIKNNADLVELHLPFAKLKHLVLRHFKMKTLNLGQTPNLKSLELYKCDDLLELHMPIESPELETVEVKFSRLRTLNLTGAQNLKRLDLVCEYLLDLHMPNESPELKTIIARHCSRLKTLNLTGTRNLEMLNLEEFEELEQLDMPIKTPKLKAIHIHHSNLETLQLGPSPYLEQLHLSVGCPGGCVHFTVGPLAELHLIARSFGKCPFHPHNNLPISFECIYKDLLTTLNRTFEKLNSSGLYDCTKPASFLGSICGLQHLRKLTLEGSIPEVPNEIEQLECLEELTLLATNIEHLPDSICKLKHLKVLELKSCSFLKQLPEDIGRLECLEKLRISYCTSLRDIPNSICEMTRLKYFHLTNCILVEKLPKKIGCLKCLEVLNINGTGIIYLPESIFELEDLLFLL